jgi:eukaryotic-like serine/threonine-protein kinase
MMGNKSFVFRFDDVEVREGEFSLTKAGQVSTVEPKAFRALLLLLRNPQRLISKEELIQWVWGDTAVGDGSLTRCIWLLRRLLGDDSNEPRYIETVSTVGYRFVCPVEATIDSAAAADAPMQPGEPQAVPVKTTRRALGLWLALAGIAMALGFALFVRFARHDSDGAMPLLVTAIPPPPGEGFWANITKPVAVSPDGKFLAIISMRNGHRDLWLRRLDGAESQLIAGTDEASNPFWSPDSRYVGFFAEGKLKKVDVAGGTVSDLCLVGDVPFGGSWSSEGLIVFAGFDALRRVPDGGGTPEPVSGLALSNGATGQFWPEFLPDGKHFLYLEWRFAGYGGGENDVWIGSLDGMKPRRFPLAATNVQYASGYLLFSRNGDLYAQKFDLSRLELKGNALLVAKNIQYDTFLEDAAFSASLNGILVYAPSGTGVNSALAWMDRDGKTLSTLDDAGQFIMQSISPDGKRVAVGVKPSDSREKIWIYDIDRGTRIPLVTQETGPSRESPIWGPRWSPDGRQVAYRYLQEKGGGVAMHASDGSGQERQVAQRQDGSVQVDDWTPDGAYIVCTWDKYPGTSHVKRTMRASPVAGDTKSGFEIDNAGSGKFSPDGHWLAFDDDASGQIYVTPFPGPGGRIAVISAGGSDPRWRGDGQELLYIANDRTVVSVQVHESPQEFHVLSSHPLFRLSLPKGSQFYDVTRDARRFLVNVRTPKEQNAPLTVVTNWASQF